MTEIKKCLKEVMIVIMKDKMAWECCKSSFQGQMVGEEHYYLSHLWDYLVVEVMKISWIFQGGLHATEMKHGAIMIDLIDMMILDIFIRIIAKTMEMVITINNNNSNIIVETPNKINTITLIIISSSRVTRTLTTIFKIMKIIWIMVVVRINKTIITTMVIKIRIRILQLTITMGRMKETIMIISSVVVGITTISSHLTRKIITIKIKILNQTLEEEMINLIKMMVIITRNSIIPIIICRTRSTNSKTSKMTIKMITITRMIMVIMKAITIMITTMIKIKIKTNVQPKM